MNNRTQNLGYAVAVLAVLSSDGGTIIINAKADEPAIPADSSAFQRIRRIDGATLTCLWL